MKHMKIKKIYINKYNEQSSRRFHSYHHKKKKRDGYIRLK